MSRNHASDFQVNNDGILISPLSCKDNMRTVHENPTTQSTDSSFDVTHAAVEAISSAVGSVKKTMRLLCEHPPKGTKILCYGVEVIHGVINQKQGDSVERIVAGTLSTATKMMIGGVLLSGIVFIPGMQLPIILGVAGETWVVLGVGILLQNSMEKVLRPVGHAASALVHMAFLAAQKKQKKNNHRLTIEAPQMIPDAKKIEQLTKPSEEDNDFLEMLAAENVFASYSSARPVSKFSATPAPAFATHAPAVLAPSFFAHLSSVNLPRNSVEKKTTTPLRSLSMYAASGNNAASTTTEPHGSTANQYASTASGHRTSSTSDGKQRSLYIEMTADRYGRDGVKIDGVVKHLGPYRRL